VTVAAALHGTIVSIEVGRGDDVRHGQVVALIESMKMHHEVTAPVGGSIGDVLVAVGDTVTAGQAILVVIQRAGAETAAIVRDGPRQGGPRPDLAEVADRHAGVLDAARPAAVARRRASGRRTARENIADLVDDGSFVEYGPMVIAAQRRRRDVGELIATTPADGMVGGLATVNADLHPGSDARCVVVSYDYTVLAGTQGTMNHLKKDRLFELAERLRLPVVFFTEGGGGRPGDTDGTGVTGLDCLAFRWFAELSGLVPLVGVNAGYCFAGNAAILGCCDVVIATADSNIGMGGPAMIEGGGLGAVAPTSIGPIGVQRANGVVDVVAADEAEAVVLAKRYLSYFQGDTASWTCADQALARDIVPLDRMRAYDVRRAMDVLFDTDSVLELRRDFGVGIVTVLARIEGRAVGVVANNPTHLGGAIDSDGADKAARFMQLCDAFDLPIITLCDTPGMMVGPDAEETALVRHCSRLFVTGANVTVPTIAIVLRKAYGLGAQAMMGGSTKAPLACVAWPTGEFGGMGLEGAVRLGYRKELDAVADDAARDALYRELVDRLYEHGKALSVATHFEIDDVIDPADTRRWITAILAASPRPSRSGKKRPNIDTW
jgi:acetyl-CoA carboxylase carboxyltransferase component